MAAKDSKGEGGGGQSAIRPLDGLLELKLLQNPNSSLLRL